MAVSISLDKGAARATHGASFSHESWIDLARALCCLGVIFLHSSLGFLESDPASIVGLFRFGLWSSLRMAFGRFGVPIFLMITGYLLLNEAHSFSFKKMLTHMVRIAALLFIFAFPFNILESYAVTRELSFELISSSFISFLHGNSWDHTWYLFALIWIYPLIFVLRPLVERLSKLAYLVILGAYCILLMLPLTLERILPGTFAALGPLPDQTCAFFYVLLGDYLRRFERKNSMTLMRAGVLSLVLFVVFEVFFARFLGRIPVALENYPSPLVAIYSVALFQLLRRAAPPKSQGLKAWVKRLSADSLGMYITHPIFINVLYKALDFSPVTTPVGSLLPFYAAFVLFSFVLTEFMRRVPILSSLL